MQQRHAAHDTRFVCREEHSPREQVIAPVSLAVIGRTLVVRYCWRVRVIGGGVMVSELADDIHNSVSERVRRTAPRVARDKCCTVRLVVRRGDARSDRKLSERKDAAYEGVSKAPPPRVPRAQPFLPSSGHPAPR